METPMKTPVTFSELRILGGMFLTFGILLTSIVGAYFSLSTNQALMSQQMKAISDRQDRFATAIKDERGDIDTLKADSATIKQALRDRGILALKPGSDELAVAPVAGPSAQLSPVTPQSTSSTSTETTFIVAPTPVPQPTQQPQPTPAQSFPVLSPVNTLLDTVGKIL